VLAAIGTLRDRRAARGWIVLAAALLCAAGIARLDLRDDLRQWVSLPGPLIQQAREIGEITGFMPTSQFFLVRADSDDELLRRTAQVDAALDPLKARHELASYLSLSQLVAPVAEQRQTQARLAELAAQDQPWQAFQQAGIPVAAVQAELKTLSALPAMGIDAALAGPQAEAWRGLWLGRHDGRSAAIVTLQGLPDASVLAGVAAHIPGVTLVDQNGELNRMFTTTRIEAALLKLASYVLAALILLATLGRHATWRILAVPLAATCCTLAALGWLGLPLTLFSLFGLLLVSAIGVDYAVFIYERIAGPQASLVGIMLAASCTLLSFGLLAFSGTPAIANFGLTVALGIVFCLLTAPWLTYSYKESHHDGNP
jgi:predicted exporter